ncbi:MAG: PAS domain S-box protein, partial [Planctomycetes bacterium]|nr:PAS domain S-box protein [Planctomycetota bacterium]
TNRRLGWTNEQVSKLTGYSRKELRGQNARILYESQEEYERVARVKDPQIEKTGTGSTETRWKRKDGGICDIVLSSAALDPTDLSAGLIFTALDITQRKHAEAEAQLRRNELAHASRLSTIGEMASGLAHELNQPLTAISTFSAGCLRMLKPGSSVSEEVLAAMQNVAAQATRAGEIIHRIRNFTRKQELKRKNTDINRILTDGTDLIETDIRQKKVKVHLDLGAGIPTVPVDAIQIEQVTLNLIRNGIEAMDDPSITDRRLHIITRITDSKNMVEVSIQDRGVGIDPDKTEEIFDSFYTTKKLGLGIGLSLSRSIIESHGGHLWAASNPAGGATFKFTLPLKIENDI